MGKMPMAHLSQRLATHAQQQHSGQSLLNYLQYTPSWNADISVGGSCVHACCCEASMHWAACFGQRSKWPVDWRHAARTLKPCDIRPYERPAAACKHAELQGARARVASHGTHKRCIVLSGAVAGGGLRAAQRAHEPPGTRREALRAWAAQVVRHMYRGVAVEEGDLCARVPVQVLKAHHAFAPLPL